MSRLLAFRARFVVGLVMALLSYYQAGFAGQGGSSKGNGGQGTGGSGGNVAGGGGSGNSGGSGGASSGGGGSGFSIEAEILAYKALQSDSEAIACDIAGFLSQIDGTVVDSPFGQNPHSKDRSKVLVPRLIGEKYWGDLPDKPRVCQLTGKLSRPTSTSPGVVLISSTDTTVTNFQLWRLNMAIMKQFRLRSLGYSCPPPKQQGESASVVGDAAAAADQVVTLVKDVVGLFATTESSVGFTGTIQDQALIDAVGRQLRAINVPVLIPGTYSPFTLGGIDSENSPFLLSLANLLTVRACLQGQQTPDASVLDMLQAIDSDQQQIDSGKLSAKDVALKQTEIDNLKKELAKVKVTPGDRAVSQKLQKNVTDRGSLVSSIDAFLASLNGTPQPASASSSNSNQVNQGQQSNSASPTKDAGNGPTSSTPPIASVLAADGLARAMGVNTNGDLAIPGWHLLWLKALESGGSMLTKSNLLGSKVFYSGGAVSTYALFELNGQLSCSGNLYDYNGNIREKNFQKKFRKPNIDPEDHLIFFRSRCSTPEPPASASSSGYNLRSGEDEEISVDESSIVFPATIVGQSTKRKLNLKNATNHDIEFAPSVEGSEFTEATNCGTTVKGSETCVLEITFAPISDGTKTATLSIQPSGPVIVVRLSGVGKMAQ